MKTCTLIPTFMIFLLLTTSECLSFEWGRSSAGAAGFDAEKLDRLQTELEEKGTKSLLIIRNGKIAHEWYADQWDRNRKHYSASLAKSLVGGLSLMLAFEDGEIFLDAPACRYIPEWKDDGTKAVITVRQLATHTSGLEDAEISDEELQRLRAEGMVINDLHMDLPGWKGQFWKKDPDPFSVARDHTPVISQPGSRFAYSNPGMAMLAYAVTSAISDTEHPNIRTLLKERIMEPLGISEEEWSIGYGNTYRVNGLELVANWGGGSFTPGAVARIGQLMLQKGSWDGERLLDPETISLATSYAGMPLPDRPPENPFMGSGLGWYSNFDGIWPGIPRDAFCGAGAGNQVLMVVPSLDLVIVRNGSSLFDPAEGEAFWGGMYTRLFKPLFEAFVEPPCPPSSWQAKFEGLASLSRKADGSDNWPSTWGDDDAIYTAYGDGWGFEPRTEIKLSLGLARITGNPDNFKGTNIRTVTGERTGQGEAGPKASGMLMVEGCLYMLVRNTGNSTLAWSEDHGATWEWADWKLESSFGCPSFINYGKNYRYGPDDYVYIISPNAETAYASADGLVMARAPRTAVRERNEWGFLIGTDIRNQPQWSNDIRLAAPIFTNPGLTYRSSISWNQALKRYFLCQVNFGESPRFSGGFGLYESEKPWGPWSTVFYTREWDTGPGESMNIPTKWISDDGRTMHLLFSGDDSFSVRKFELERRNPGSD